MGKRSSFERVEKDFYRTIDPRAVKALAPFLGNQTFSEPCVGAGDLKNSLEQIGLTCVQESDLETGTDALSIEDFKGDLIITNPPWSRDILHKMIVHFSEHKPTWLLFDAAWAHTRQSKDYIHLCTDIVSVGRLIWIPGTTMSGKDDCAWYRFEKGKYDGTKFHGRT